MASPLVAWTLALVAALSAAPGWLGVLLEAGATRPVVAEVIPGSPAAAAGLRPGDIVTAVGTIRVRDVAGFAAAMRRYDAGETLRLRLERAGAEVRVEAVLARRPGDPGVGTVRVESPGAVLRPALGLRLALRDTALEVTEVVPGGPGAAAGVAVGDRLHRVGTDSIRSVRDLDRALTGMLPGADVRLVVQRPADAGPRLLVLRLDAAPVPAVEVRIGQPPGAGPIAGSGRGAVVLVRQEIALLRREVRELRRLLEAVREQR